MLALERFPDEAALKTFVQGVGRPIARELIYRTVADSPRSTTSPTRS